MPHSAGSGAVRCCSSRGTRPHAGRLASCSETASPRSPSSGASARRALAQDQTIDIVTTGAKTGERRTTEIWFTRVGDAIYITGTPAGDGTTGARRKRDWLANLTAHPDFEFVLKESVDAVLPAVLKDANPAGINRRVNGTVSTGEVHR